MVRILFFLIVVTMLTSCIFDHKLTLAKSHNVSSSLLLDGIYLHTDSLDIVDLYFLYEDGTILSRGSVHIEDLETKLEQLDQSNDEKYKSMKFLWGKYIIEGDKIVFERWAPTDKPYRAYRREGIILNETTFVIHQLSDINGNGLRVIDETYRFRKTNTKPDSGNEWIKEKRRF